MGEAIDPMGNLMTAPGIGYFREPQEKMQKGIQIALDYQQSNAKFNQALTHVSIESIQGYQERLQNQMTDPQSDLKPSSLRELYDLWIIVSEEHYAEFAMSEEYQSLYGDMVNRLMALKKHISETTDELMTSMNMPSRSEVETMQQRLQQLRRDNYELRDELKEIKSLLVKNQQTSTPVKAEQIAVVKQDAVKPRSEPATAKKASLKKPAPEKAVAKKAAVKKVVAKKKNSPKLQSKTGA
jgi:hypothetical protein